mmetsp:Transcript_54217/g.150834  ORF Transcript_54217/g.150834 Transcript_54217/m.150834 type:complete len:207 (+) Transcript_54217:191-811(+)
MDGAGAPAAEAYVERGPHRVVELSCLSERMVNHIEDEVFDLDLADKWSDRPLRIRLEESPFASLVKSDFSSQRTSRFASTSPTLLRGCLGQTRVESSRCVRELEMIFRDLKELESLPLASRGNIRRASEAVRVAIEAERYVTPRKRRRSRECTFVTVSLMMVPLFPAIIATAILLQVPSARARGMEILCGALWNLFFCLPASSFRR